MTEQRTNRIIAVPCPYMIFDKNHYTQCELFPAPKFTDPITHEEIGPGFCVCAWFYDVCDPGYYIESTVNPKTGKIGLTSDFSFQDRAEEYETRCTREEDVPKLCPRGFTWKQIDAKIKAFDPWMARP